MKYRKNQTIPQSRITKGFALVVSLTMLVLLTVIAVELLSLSAITLRTANQNTARAEAQANARLALMIAIGELQKEMGPDRRISATSEILATPSAAVAKPNTTGVWESWSDFNPHASPSPNYQKEKTNRFRAWLVSSTDVNALKSRDFVTSPWQGRSIDLAGPGLL